MNARTVLCFLLLAACGDDDGAVDAGDGGVEDDGAIDGALESGVDMGPRVVVRPSEREACTDRNPLRNPYFGDLHVHTRFSFDAASYDIRTGPADAYRFAQGEEIGLPPFDDEGNPTRTYQLTRPLDFAAVTDHAELLDATTICTDPSAEGFDSRTCRSYRESGGAMGAFGDFVRAIGTQPPGPVTFCAANPEICASTLSDVWERSIEAAEAAYDRTSSCRFTTFIGYEWTGSSGPGRNLHRNVFFRSATSLRVPTSYVQAPTPEMLWDALERDCLESGTDCDLLIIPHNGNIGTGEMFVPVTEDGSPYDAAFAQRRAELEPLLEIYQHKGASECISVGSDPLSSEDEFCRFEQLFERFCESPDDTGCTPLCDERGGAGFVGFGCYQPRDFARGALRNGLAELVRTGADPFRMGFVASTDTHGSLAGAVDESDWPGHTGDADDDLEERLTPVGTGINVSLRSSSPGGLAVVWAEENSRPSLFDAMRRRETYGTSGTRIVARFFGAWGYADDLCDAPNFVAQADSEGVPMGALLPARVGDGAPSFLVAAMADALGAPLQRIQLIKGEVDPASGETQEFVIELAGGDNGADVDLATCERRGEGATDLCSVWTDPDFRPDRPAFYYARIIENPTCRWSHRVCLEAALDCDSVDAGTPESTCCSDEVPRTVQERAWTSPIWYIPT